MSIVVRFPPAALTAEQYDETVQKARGGRRLPPDGLEYHVCFGSDGNLRVSEIWDSREQSRRSASGSCRSWPRSGSRSPASRR